MRLKSRNDNGVALIIVLWVITLLTVMVNGFIALVRTEATGVINYKAQTQAYYYARSGVSVAVEKIAQSLVKEPEIAPEETAPEIVLPEIETWIPDGRNYTIDLDDAQIDISIMDEGAKMDINKTTRSDLIRALIELDILGVERDIIADSILDWRDENNFHRLNGAEDDYYKMRSRPYESKDAPLDTIDELLWVRGVTPDIFYGGDRDFGLVDMFTVYTNSVKVNINTAPLAVLSALPGMDEEIAWLIVDFREEIDIQDMGAFTDAGGQLAPGVTKYITFTQAGIYSIRSTAQFKDDPIKRSISAVVKIDEGERRFLYWKDEDHPKRIRQWQTMRQ